MHTGILTEDVLATCINSEEIIQNNGATVKFVCYDISLIMMLLSCPENFSTHIAIYLCTSDIILIVWL